MKHNYPEEVRRMIKAFAREMPAGPLLDLGCGKGEFAVFFAEKGRAVTAVGMVEEDTIATKKRADAHGVGNRMQCMTQDLRQYVITEEQACIICVRDLNRCNPRVPTIIKQMQEKTRPGGINFVAAFLNKGDLDWKRAYWLPGGELKELYEGWKLHYYEEGLCETTDLDSEGSPRHHMAVFMVASKPQKEVKIPGITE